MTRLQGGARVLAMAVFLAAPAAAARAACPEVAATPGESVAIIEGLQRELALAGFDPGGFDGRAGPATVDAIRRYERTAGLSPTGCPTRELLDRISFGLPKVHSFDRPAVPGVAVEVQEELTRRGYYVGAVDGVVGPRTRRALREFQARAGLPPTGEPDPRTVSELRTGRVDVRR